MRNVLVSAIAVLALVALVGCGGGDPPAAPTGFAPNQTTEAYAYVHGGYVGQAVVTTDANGAITATLDEAFLPHTLAVVDMDAAEWTEDNTAYYVSRGNQVRVATWVVYNGTTYTGVTVGSGLSYVAAGDDGSAAGGADLEMTIIRNEANMKAYFEGVQNGAFQTLTQFGGNPTPVTTTRFNSVVKRGSNYWPQGLGWQGNIDAVEAAAAQYGISFGLNEMNRRSDNNRWELADAVTGATLSDFPDYFALIQLAAARLKMQ